MSEREVYRTFRRSKGFSDYRDAETNHQKATGTCWWCFRPVLSSLHDYKACHEGMFETVTHYKREPKVDDQPSLFGGAA